MKKLLGIVVLGLLLSGCQSPEEKAFNNISRNKGNEKSEIKLIRGCSRKPSTYESIEGREFDLIFIDGDHSYKGVKNDFTRAKEYLKEGGFIVLDDYGEENKLHKSSHKGVVRFANKTINPNRWKKVGVFFETQLVLQENLNGQGNPQSKGV